MPFKKKSTFKGVTISFKHLHRQDVIAYGSKSDELSISLWDSKDFIAVKFTIADPFSLYFFMEQSAASSSIPITYDLIQQFSRHAQPKQNVPITFPQIEFTQNIDLTNLFQRSSISEAYSPFEAHFSGLSTEKIYFSDTRLSANFSITPEGDVSSSGVLAVTFSQGQGENSKIRHTNQEQYLQGRTHEVANPSFPVQLAQTSQDDKEEIIFDKPLHFIVYHDILDIVLYVGYYTNPFQKN